MTWDYHMPMGWDDGPNGRIPVFLPLPRPEPVDDPAPTSKTMLVWAFNPDGMRTIVDRYGVDSANMMLADMVRFAEDSSVDSMEQPVLNQFGVRRLYIERWGNDIVLVSALKPWVDDVVVLRLVEVEA